MKEGLFEKHPLWSGVIVLGAVVGIFAAMSFRELQLAIITFTAVAILMIYYFDSRIKKLESKAGEKEKIYNNEKDTKEMIKMNKRGLTQLAWLLIIVLVLILLYFLLKGPS